MCINSSTLLLIVYDLTRTRLCLLSVVSCLSCMCVLLVRRHDGLSKFFPEADMAKVATKCWKQVQPQIRKETNVSCTT